MTKEPVRIRKRKNASGTTSLYLDIYVDGVRKYEFMKLYLIPEDSKKSKEINAETMRLAEAIKSKRIVEIHNGKFGFNVNKAKETKFFEYYNRLCYERLENGETRSNHSNWFCCMHHLKKYEHNQNITFDEITPEWVKGFKNYLEKQAIAWQHDVRKRKVETHLARNSMVSYFNKLRACINQAYEERIIDINPLRGIDSFKAEEGTRMYLTIEEIEKLVNTECEYPRIKDAFLFSCLTGIRRGDIVNLKWSDVHKQGDYTRIIFRQRKTKGQEYLDISSQATELMGERGEPNEYIFGDIHTPGCTNNTIAVWVAKAGIDKKITFHCARHTFAVMMLDLGTDIYTTSKLLGHKNINTTQIYAKVLDKNKQAAVARIPDIINKKNCSK